VRAVDFGVMVFDKSGKFVSRDQMFLDSIRLMNAGHLDDRDRHGRSAVVPARHRFALKEFNRKYRWEPSVAILNKIRAMLFKR
jgi:hypothetical protein